MFVNEILISYLCDFNISSSKGVWPRRLTLEPCVPARKNLGNNKLIIK